MLRQEITKGIWRVRLVEVVEQKISEIDRGNNSEITKFEIKMTTLYNKNHRSVIDSHKDSHEIKKLPNCVLLSQDGYKFKIHEKLLTQTKRMHDIVEDAKDSDCCGMIKIVLFTVPAVRNSAAWYVLASSPFLPHRHQSDHLIFARVRDKSRVSKQMHVNLTKELERKRGNVKVLR